MAKTIYATRPVNVNGTHFEAGDEIECGQGARQSLLRMGQASEKKPSAPDPAPPSNPPGGQGDPNAGNNDPQAGGDPQPTLPEGHTSVGALKLENAQHKKALVDAGILSIEQLQDYLDNGDQKLTALAGIAEAGEGKILAALDAYEPPQQ